MNLGDMTVGADPEELFLCPYDQSHVIRKKIMPYHLMKCRKNWTGKEYRTCPFNANHQVPAPEFIGHKQLCEDRYIIERDLEIMMKKKKDKSGCTIPVAKPIEPEIVPESTEDWDRDLQVEQKMFRSRFYQQSYEDNGAPGRTSLLNNSLSHSFETSFRSVPLAPSRDATASPFCRVDNHSSIPFVDSAPKVLGRGMPTAATMQAAVPGKSFEDAMALDGAHSGVGRGRGGGVNVTKNTLPSSNGFGNSGVSLGRGRGLQ